MIVYAVRDKATGWYTGHKNSTYWAQSPLSLARFYPNETTPRQLIAALHKHSPKLDLEIVAFELTEIADEQR